MDFCRKTILLLIFSSFMSVGWGQDCDEGYVPDCSGDGDCCSEDWIGDGYCDNEDQSWGCDLICYEEELSDCGHFPQLYYHPNELSEELEQNNSSNIIFTIVNNGDETLEWEVLNQDEIPNWLSFTIYGGFLEPGSLEEIDVTFDSSELNIGEYNSTITISSNDPFNGEIVVPVSLTIISQSLCDEEIEVELWGECYNIEETTELDLSWNELTGEIPSEIGNLTNLTTLNLNGNQLTGLIPSEIGDLTNLTYLDLSYNELGCYEYDFDGDCDFWNQFECCITHCDETDECNGEIPPEIGNLTNLTTLWLYYNQLTGSIPPEIGNLTNLPDLRLYGNQLSGEIPPEIGNLTNLNTLWLSHNQLIGEIPPEIGNLTNLTNLYLYENQLTGEIPSTIGNLENLTYLDLSSNQLTGEIPSEIGNLTSLIGLYLYGNELTGEIPLEIGNLTNLRYLYLQNNQLTGEIPSSIGNLTNLIYLILDENQLSGSIPSSIGNLINVSNLRLNDNSLSGEIPSEIGSLINLNTLCLQNNQLSGEIPESICEVFPLSWGFSISNNNLCPPYPDCGGGPITSEEEQDTSECVECPDSIEGDTNYDGYVNILDIITVVNCILSTDCNVCFDINYDSSVDILDIISMINVILEP